MRRQTSWIERLPKLQNVKDFGLAMIQRPQAHVPTTKSPLEHRTCAYNGCAGVTPVLEDATKGRLHCAGLTLENLEEDILDDQKQASDIDLAVVHLGDRNDLSEFAVQICVRRQRLPTIVDKAMQRHVWAISTR